MSEVSLPEAFELLGVAPNDSLLQVRLAYQLQKSLYAEDALASYALFTPALRQVRLERIETAYRLIVRQLAKPPAEVVPLHAAVEMKRDGEEAPVLTDPEQPLGALLKQARDRAGLSLQEIARRTKVGTRYLEAIECERFEQLPATVYLRGFVIQYARLVGLQDSEQVAELYLQRRRCRPGTAEDGP